MKVGPASKLRGTIPGWRKISTNLRSRDTSHTRSSSLNRGLRKKGVAVLNTRIALSLDSNREYEMGFRLTTHRAIRFKNFERQLAA